ncbi:unannotated protein [freshwater metagenome]|uniref:Unannotated protein n=1 Tax=freshwater metagenome TaxID=449393 RepID=A0A6J6U0C0_9ZZZZ
MPTKSSGLVSRRTKMTFFPDFERSNALLESKTASPTAAPGDAGIPRAISFNGPEVSNCGNINIAN